MGRAYFPHEKDLINTLGNLGVCRGVGQSKLIPTVENNGGYCKLQMKIGNRTVTGRLTTYPSQYTVIRFDKPWFAGKTFFFTTKNVVPKIKDFFEAALYRHDFDEAVTYSDRQQ